MHKEEKDAHKQKEENIPPQSVANNAKKGLDLHKQWKKGGTHIGVVRAQQLVRRQALSIRTIFRMVSYFARHRVDKKAKDFGNEQNPSKGYIAWLLWGGDEGDAWVREKKKEIEKATKITATKREKI